MTRKKAITKLHALKLRILYLLVSYLVTQMNEDTTHGFSKPVINDRNYIIIINEVYCVVFVRLDDRNICP